MVSKEQVTPITKDYRNCRYQGLSQNLEPYGQGILLDDSLRFIVGTWFQSEINGNVIVIDSHEKYIYGLWRDGLPEGINVYRGGKTILLANFVKGKIVGKFIVIFEAQRLMLTVEMQRLEAIIISRKQNINKQDIQKAGRQIISDKHNSEIFSLKSFINQSYGISPQGSGIQYQNQNDLLYLGIKNGLGIVLGEDNFIHKVGHLSPERQVIGIGGKYSYSFSKEGDFESQQIITSQNRKQDQLKAILHNSFLKSMVFQNNYLLTKVPLVLHYINTILKQNVISKISQQSIYDSRRFNTQQFNDSLEYCNKENKQNQKLKKMRAELYLSIGRPGSEIKPISDSKINQFINIQQRQANSKYSISNKYANFGKKGIKGIDDDKNQQTARFEMANFRRQTSPLRYEKKKSYTNNIVDKQLYNHKPGWIEQCKQVIETRKSRSPIRGASIYIPSTINQPIISPQVSATFGNRSSYSNLAAIQKSNNSHSSSSIKYQNLKQKRERILNEYKNIGSITQSSPPKITHIIQSHSIAQSPLNHLKATDKHSRNESTDIKTISRRFDKAQVTPSRSPQRYSYLNSLGLDE